VCVQPFSFRNTHIQLQYRHFKKIGTGGGRAEDAADDGAVDLLTAGAGAGAASGRRPPTDTCGRGGGLPRRSWRPFSECSAYSTNTNEQGMGRVLSMAVLLVSIRVLLVSIGVLLVLLGLPCAPPGMGSLETSVARGREKSGGGKGGETTQTQQHACDVVRVPAGGGEAGDGRWKRRAPEETCSFSLPHILR